MMVIERWLDEFLHWFRWGGGSQILRGFRTDRQESEQPARRAKLVRCLMQWCAGREARLMSGGRHDTATPRRGGGDADGAKSGTTNCRADATEAISMTGAGKADSIKLKRGAGVGADDRH